MRWSIWLAAVGGILCVALGASALNNIPLWGSGTLYNATAQVLANCPGATGLTFGSTGSSGDGEQGLINGLQANSGAQTVAPMGRMLGAAVCGSPASAQSSAEGLVVGMDAIAILGSSTNAGSAACNGVVLTNCNQEAAGAAYSTTISLPNNTTYTFQDWRDVLRVLLAGFTHDVVGTGPAQWAARDCNSATRQAIANNYGAFFENGCAAPSGDSTGGVCTQIRHIFRPDDFSAASDTLTSLLGLPSVIPPETTVTVFPGGISTQQLQHTGASPFCNAVRPAFVLPQSTGQPEPTCLQGPDATWDPTSQNLGTGCTKENAVYRSAMQDNDPIRRTCFGSGTSAPGALPAEDNCSHSGDLGLVLVMNDVSEAYDSGSVSDPLRYNATPCATGYFTSVTAPDVYDAISQAKQICTRGLLCPNGDFCNVFGGCLAPADTNYNPQCLASKLTAPTIVANTVAVPAIHPRLVGIAEGRAFNQHLYVMDPVSHAGGYQNNGSRSALPVTGAYYRIHANHSMNPGTNSTCQFADATDQIACLVQASPCSIGLASKGLSVAGGSSPGTVAIKVNGELPLPQCVDGMDYPLWNKLYLNTIAGFGQVTGQELALAQCESDPNIGYSSMVGAGFGPLPSSPNGGNPYCEDFNEKVLCGQGQNVNACAANASVGLPTASTSCGNGIVEAYEQCDDGAGNGTDGVCSQICRMVNKPVPFMLASGGSPTSVAVDTTTVYWTSQSDGTVWSVGLWGGTPTRLASGQALPSGIAVDPESLGSARFVYWTNYGVDDGTGTGNYVQGSVMAVPVGGGTPVTLASGTSALEPGFIADDGTYIYWTNAAPQFGGDLMKVSRGGGDPIPVVGESVSGAFAVDVNSNVYWAGLGEIEKLSSTGSVMALAEFFVTPTVLAVDASNVYWASSDGNVTKVSMNGGSTTQLASGSAPTQCVPTELAVDPNYVYYTCQGTGSVMKVPVGGGPLPIAPIPVAVGQNAPFGIATDGVGNVYWANTSMSGNDGSVMKVAEACAGGACACPATTLQCGSSCATIATDPSNCGRCGHSCGGGMCVAGVCQPVTLAPAEVPSAIAVDATAVYWGDGSTVLKCATGGCAMAPTILGSAPIGASGVYGIAVDTTNVYWTTLTGVEACAIGGCGLAPTTLASSQNGPWGIAVKAGTVYWADDATAGTLMSCATGGCGMAPSSLGPTQSYPLSVAVDSTNIYWTTYNAVMKCPVGNCSSPTTLATGLTNPYGLAIDANNVYWTNKVAATGSVLKCAIGGCTTPTVLATNQNSPTGIAVDASGVYWANNALGTGSVMTCATTGCAAPTALASNQNGPLSIAVDSTSVYWTNSINGAGFGAVMKLAKP